MFGELLDVYDMVDVDLPILMRVSDRLLSDAKKNDDGAGNLIRHKIKNGETLGGIAMKYRVTVKQIMRWNNMRNTKIRAGKYLKIYK